MVMKASLHKIGFLLDYHRDIDKNLIWIKPEDASIRINPDNNKDFEVPEGFKNAFDLSDDEYCQAIGHVGNMRLNIIEKETRIRQAIEEWNLFRTLKETKKPTDDFTLQAMGMILINKHVSAIKCDVLSDKFASITADAIKIRSMSLLDWNRILCSLEMQYYTVRKMSDFLINCRVYLMIANDVKEKKGDGGQKQD